MTPKSSHLRTTRWRATIIVEFDVRNYPANELGTARLNAELAKRGTERADHNINCSRNRVSLSSVIRVSD